VPRRAVTVLDRWARMNRRPRRCGARPTVTACRASSRPTLLDRVGPTRHVLRMVPTARRQAFPLPIPPARRSCSPAWVDLVRHIEIVYDDETLARSTSRSGSPAGGAARELKQLRH